MPITTDAEWLEADGLGGFASGTVTGVRTRRYHALLLAATRPPTGRLVLVNGFDARVETAQGSYAISSQRYGGDAVSPDGSRRIDAFESDPWPRWVYLLEDGTRIEQQLFVPRGKPVVALSWRLLGAKKPASLVMRPFLSGRDYHALHHENPSFRFDAEVTGGRVSWHPYEGVPGVIALSNGAYGHEPFWYRGFVYEEERARGLDFAEDLASPGVFRFDLSQGEAHLVLAVDGHEIAFGGLREAEGRRREAFPSRLHRAADAYLVKRGDGLTIVAGYPWFADWGRDTFIALRGLCLAGDRLEEAGSILLEWSRAVSEGMLPNRFPDRPDEAPEFNSVDASLWYVVAVHEYLQAAKVSAKDRRALEGAVQLILDGYARGTRHGIRMDADGLLAAGEAGVQLTWMDAKVGDWVVTPRIGKPVEVQALWLNALRIGGERWREDFERGLASFRARFWNDAKGCLYDVVDPVDGALRPNQVLAVGGLPFPLLEDEMARQVVDLVEEQLWTPLGLRSLARSEAGYIGRYEGGVRERDGAYHQGTVWPWLLGAFVEAWVRVRGGSAEVKAEARRRFLEPLLRHLDEAGLGHVSEIADGDAPHTPRGCPFQAWSVGEALRLDRDVLRVGQESRRGGVARSPRQQEAIR